MRIAVFASVFLLALLVSGTSVPAAQLKVISSGAYRSALEVIIPLFETASAHKIVAQYDSAAMVARKIEEGEAFDLAITSSGALERLVKNGIVSEFGHAVVGGNTASLVYRRGSPRPAIATPDELKAALLGAKTISFSNPAGGGSSSNYFAGIIRELGIAEEVRRKAILTKSGQGAFPVGDGRAELGVAQTSEIAMVPNVEGVPIFPSDPKSKSRYAAGVSSKSMEAEAARAFIRFMLSPEASAIRRAKGLAVD